MLESRLGRRPLLRCLTGGGTIFWTFLTKLDAAKAGATSGKAPAGRIPPLIVLDAGHGGHDPGAVAVDGTFEKDITLPTALALKTALEAVGGYRVALTRSDDRYIAPEDRADIAHGLGASLLISMHADELSDPSVRGASVYTLARSASDAETAALADRENSAGPAEDSQIDRVGPEVAEILASLAARETHTASIRMARQLVRDLSPRLPVLPQPERHANFAVLRAADIPSVLIEMGFLSNPEDAAALNDPAHRMVIAHAMTRAVDAWFARSRGDGLL